MAFRNLWHEIFPSSMSVWRRPASEVLCYTPAHLCRFSYIYFPFLVLSWSLRHHFPQGMWDLIYSNAVCYRIGWIWCSGRPPPRGGKPGLSQGRPSTTPQESELLLQVKREIAILKSLDHPNIIQLHEVCCAHPSCSILFNLFALKYMSLDSSSC